MFNNPSVDFALAKCITKDPNNPEFLIYTFDTTVAKSSLSVKENNSVALLEQKTKLLTRKIKTHHHILCLQEKCLPTLPVNKFVDIRYSNIEKIKIEVVPEKQQIRDVFEEVLGFVIRLL